MSRLAKHSRIAGPAQPRSVRGPRTLSGVFPLALGALISLGGCVAERDARPLEEPRAGAPLEIEAEAVLSLGVVAGDSLREFDRVVAPFVLPDGRSESAKVALDQVIDLAVSRTPADRASVTRARLEAAQVPGELSVFWDFRLDPEGFLWIQPYQPLAHSFALGARYAGGVGNGGGWLVITPDGSDAGSIEVPDGLELTQITRTSVVGIRRDALGVESVHVHRVRRN